MTSFQINALKDISIVLENDPNADFSTLLAHEHLKDVKSHELRKFCDSRSELETAKDVLRALYGSIHTMMVEITAVDNEIINSVFLGRGVHPGQEESRMEHLVIKWEPVMAQCDEKIEKEYCIPAEMLEIIIKTVGERENANNASSS
jgi:hypothetical protein